MFSLLLAQLGALPTLLLGENGDSPVKGKTSLSVILISVFSPHALPWSQKSKLSAIIQISQDQGRIPASFCLSAKSACCRLVKVRPPPIHLHISVSVWMFASLLGALVTMKIFLKLCLERMWVYADVWVFLKVCISELLIQDMSVLRAKAVLCKSC